MDDAPKESNKAKTEEAGTSTAGGGGGGATTTPEYNSSSIKKARLESTLAALLGDPILSDVPKKPSLSDVDTLISLELGSAMRITVLKLDGTSFEVVVMNSATVKDLKLATKKKVNDTEESSMGHRHISWKHVWVNFCLSCHNEKLLDDNALLMDYNLRNHSQKVMIERSLRASLKGGADQLSIINVATESRKDFAEERRNGKKNVINGRILI